MRPDREEQLRSVVRISFLAAVLGLASGYVVFYGVFPIVAVPAAGEASLAFMIALLAVTSFVVGLATESLVELTFECFIALFLSGLIASAMALSPMLAGLVFIQPDSVPAFLIRYGFLLFLLGLVVDLIGGTVGLAFRERYFFRGPRMQPAAWERK